MGWGKGKGMKKNKTMKKTNRKKISDGPDKNSLITYAWGRGKRVCIGGAGNST